jgi:hypothetical protein
VAELLFSVTRHCQTLALHVIQKLFFPHVINIRLWNEEWRVGPSVHYELGIPLLSHRFEAEDLKPMPYEFLIQLHRNNC